MSKELATYFSPFEPINQFSIQQLSEQQKTKKGLIDVSAAVRGKDVGRIKELEKQKIELEDKLSRFEETKKESAKWLAKYEAEVQNKRDVEKLLSEKNQEFQEKVLILADVRKAFQD